MEELEVECAKKNLKYRNSEDTSMHIALKRVIILNENSKISIFLTFQLLLFDRYYPENMKTILHCTANQTFCAADTMDQQAQPPATGAGVSVAPGTAAVDSAFFGTDSLISITTK